MEHKSMKIFFIVLLINLYCLAQQEDPIQGLYSQDENIVIEAINEIISDSIYQAIPHLIDKIESEPPFIQMDILRALSFFRHESAIPHAKRIIESADELFGTDLMLNPSKARLIATVVLFNFEDYSTASYIFELIDISKPSLSRDAIVLLPFVYKKIPKLAERSISELFYAYQNSNYDKSLKYFTFSELAELNYDSFRPEIINQLKNSDYYQIRYKAFEVLNEKNYTELNNLLKYMIQNEVESSLRILAVDSLIIKFGEPSDIYFVRNHIRIEQDSIASSLMSFTLSSFIPPRPVLSTTEMINNLINYNTEMYGYGWIRDENQYSIFDVSLNKIKEYYRRPDLENLCREIFMLNDRIETSRNEDKITTEAYKFLHYHLMYIKENVEAELGNCSQ